MRAYAGIGSRETPADVLALMEQFAYKSAVLGWTLRSGGADGADTAFELGAKQAREELGPSCKFEVFLPWDGFNGRPNAYESPTGWLYRRGSSADAEVAAEFHPAWDRLSQGVKKLHARNVCQILGGAVAFQNDCEYGVYRPDPMSAFVVCWTRDGKRGGGTGQALRIAEHYGVPIFDLALTPDRERIERFLERSSS